jgi:hypothetical protein
MEKGFAWLFVIYLKSFLSLVFFVLIVAIEIGEVDSIKFSGMTPRREINLHSP